MIGICALPFQNGYDILELRKLILSRGITKVAARNCGTKGTEFFSGELVKEIRGQNDFRKKTRKKFRPLISRKVFCHLNSVN
jgi:hypothetical protein